ncbi:hypothetical protein WH47_04561 [Habropoda laboriosa]|uniref:Uncharacterized protein n=1 Tax=Habropoda laboriosa TaxID=597456 RepID=A0A0L7R268_9HYME|nr:PREDICTED: uncharacterized protein LOC108572620 [Habropoda laboriosa]KOC64972.1 hypothetical protein WH47_04561 [Habropoda laboriosa]
MSEFKALQNALISLSESVDDFSVGAVSLDDFKPIEEKIRDKRKALKRLNSRILMLKAQNEYQTTSEEAKEDVKTTVENLHEATANSLINDAAIKLCLHSYTIEAILEGKQGDYDMQKKIFACMRKLYYFNDKVLSLANKIEDAVKEQLELKIQCQKALFDYQIFLKEQEKIRSKKLEEMNPTVARNKAKMNRYIERINIVKKLITNFIATSHHMLSEEPDLVKMLENHRETLNMETILKQFKDTVEAREQHENNETE